MLQVFDKCGRCYTPRVDLLRLDVKSVVAGENPELLSNIRDWTTDDMDKLKRIYPNKEVTTENLYSA